jgi:hypothetical protein
MNAPSVHQPFAAVHLHLHLHLQLFLLMNVENGKPVEDVEVVAVEDVKTGHRFLPIRICSVAFPASAACCLAPSTKCQASSVKYQISEHSR